MPVVFAWKATLALVHPRGNFFYCPGEKQFPQSQAALFIKSMISNCGLAGQQGPRQCKSKATKKSADQNGIHELQEFMQT